MRKATCWSWAGAARAATCRTPWTKCAAKAARCRCATSTTSTPLPRGVREIFARFRKIVVCELNEGQFAAYLRQELQEFRYEQYNKCEGLPFTVVELRRKFESLLK